MTGSGSASGGALESGGVLDNDGRPRKPRSAVSLTTDCEHRLAKLQKAADAAFGHPVASVGGARALCAEDGHVVPTRETRGGGGGKTRCSTCRERGKGEVAGEAEAEV